MKTLLFEIYIGLPRILIILCFLSFYNLLIKLLIEHLQKLIKIIYKYYKYICVEETIFVFDQSIYIGNNLEVFEKFEQK